MSFFDAETPGRTGRPSHILIALIALALCSLPAVALADGEEPSTEPALEAPAPVLNADAPAAVADEASREEGDVVAEATDGADSSDATDQADGTDESDATDDGDVDKTPEPETYGPGVVKLRLAQGIRDHARAQAVVDALNKLIPDQSASDPSAPDSSAPDESSPDRPVEDGVSKLVVDDDLRDAAAQRAAETSIWLSAERPSGAAPLAANAKEYRFHGTGLEASTVVSQIVASGVDLSAGTYRSVGVGCWEQGGVRFYVVLLGTDAANSPAEAASGIEAWSPEVAIDLDGTTSPVLQGRLQASGYRTSLSMIPESTRAVGFTWVTAPASEADFAQAGDLPVIDIDPTSFTWTSTDDAVATVSPSGVVAMHGTSILTPHSSIERGADITASLDGTDRTLSFHVSAAVPVYRLYHPGNGAHLYTTDVNEYNTLPGSGWNQEKVVWQSVWSSPVDGKITGTPIYRLLNPFNGDHHYTADLNEYNALPATGWTQEGVAYYSADGPWDPELGGQPVYRLYNSWQTANGGLGSHLWTTDSNEYATNGALGWTQEGEGLYGVR